MDWINLSQDRDQWRAFVSTVMKLWVPSEVQKLRLEVSYHWHYIPSVYKYILALTRTL
jgi:hypothetical protein